MTYPLLSSADARSASKNGQAQAENRLYFKPLPEVYSLKFLPYQNIFVILYQNSLLTTSIPTLMKKQVIALALFCCCLIGYAKDKRPFDYRFHKNDTIYLLQETEIDSIKHPIQKYQIVVLEAKGSKAVLKFTGLPNSEGLDSINNKFIDKKIPGLSLKDKEGFLNRIKSLSQSLVSPIIRYEDGKPKGMVNFKEMKDSTLVIMDNIFNMSSQQLKDAPDSMKVKGEDIDSTMTMLKQFMMPMMEMFMTEELMMSQYSDMVQGEMPQKLGKWGVTNGGTTVQVSLTATQNAGEYEYQSITKTNLNRDDLKDPQLKDNPAIETFTEMGAFGKLALAFMDSLSIESTTNGVIYSNGIPKHLVKELRTSYSMMGQTKESIKRETISVIDK